MRTLLIMIALALCSSVAIADDSIVVLLDTSGSMASNMHSPPTKSRIDVAREALINVLSNVPATTKIGVLTFDGWVYNLTSVDRTRLRESILKAEPGGGTPLYEYIKQGADALLAEREKQGNVGSYKLIIVTDGEAQDNDLDTSGTFSSGAYRPGYLEDIMSRGIVVDVIGLDMIEAHSLQTKINGNYMRGDHPELVRQSLSKSVSEVGFRGNDKISNEAFREISELPDSFIRPVLAGLTEFRNYPIGTEAPRKVVTSSGQIITTSDSAPPAERDAGMIVFGAFVAIVVLVIVVFALLLLFGDRS